MYNIRECVISEESKVCTTRGGHYFVMSWRDAPHKALRYLTEQTEDNEVVAEAPGIVREPYFMFLVLSVLTTWGLAAYAYDSDRRETQEDERDRTDIETDPLIKLLDGFWKDLKDRFYEIKNRYW